jgi:hypothetical protein
MKELVRLRRLYAHIRDIDIPPTPLGRDFLRKLRARTHTFRPRYECYCGERITRSPVKCRAFLALITKLQEVVDGSHLLPRSFPCELSDYFIFYGHTT